MRASKLSCPSPHSVLCRCTCRNHDKSELHATADLERGKRFNYAAAVRTAVAAEHDDR